MEEQLIQLLTTTQSPQEAPRTQAEQQLQSLYPHADFQLALVTVASHDSVHLPVRQAALLSLKKLVLDGWSEQFDEHKGSVHVTEQNKLRIRNSLLELATNGALDRKVKAIASYVVSKIASVDFPDQWPDLLSTLMHIIPTGNEGQVHGALKVLSELVDDALDDVKFFPVARDLVKVVYDVAINEGQKAALRALAVSIFRGCFEILEMIMEDHKAEVKAFTEEVLSQWTPFFIGVMKTKLPEPPSEQEQHDDTPSAEAYKGLVSLKLQVVKVSTFLLYDDCNSNLFL